MNVKRRRVFLLLLLFPFLAICQNQRPITEEVVVQPDTMRIYGTYQKPASNFSGDAVLIIAGSGPTDRNGNQPNMQTNSYSQMADSLAAHGIATLRYDKRFIGKSTGTVNEQQLRFSDNVVVAKAFYEQLKKDPSVKRIFIAGHSEGATVGLLLAEEVKPAGYISIAGPGFPADSILRKQLASVPQPLKTEVFAGIDSLKQGRLVQKVNPALFSLFRPAIQPYLISWFKIDPQQVIGRLTTPTLIVQGTTDIQVSTDDADALAAACKGCPKVIIEGMNHVLKKAPAERAANMATYNQPQLPLAPAFVSALVSFIQKK